MTKNFKLEAFASALFFALITLASCEADPVTPTRRDRATMTETELFRLPELISYDDDAGDLVNWWTDLSGYNYVEFTFNTMPVGFYSTRVWSTCDARPLSAIIPDDCNPEYRGIVVSDAGERIVFHNGRFVGASDIENKINVDFLRSYYPELYEFALSMK